MMKVHHDKNHSIASEVEIYECGYEGCHFKTKNKRSCYAHRMNVHSTTWNYCIVEGCNFKSLSKKSYQHHKANVHST